MVVTPVLLLLLLLCDRYLLRTWCCSGVSVSVRGRTSMACCIQ